MQEYPARANFHHKKHVSCLGLSLGLGSVCKISDVKSIVVLTDLNHKPS